MDFSIEKFPENGVAVMKNFLSEDEVRSLKEEIRNFEKQSSQSTDYSVFSTKTDANFYRDQYFMESNDKISFFYEEEDKREKKSLNKIGHALHIWNQTCKNLIFSKKTKEILQKLSFNKPIVVQSMFILKAPEVGGEVPAHQDLTYLHTDPPSGLGLWMALDDANERNGCLQVIPHSHKNGLDNDYQLVRKKEGGVLVSSYEGEKKNYDFEDFVCLPVQQGDLILIDGLVVHRSNKNSSLKSREAFVFHLYDGEVGKWDQRNWLQPSSKGNFVDIYTEKPCF